MEEKHVDHEGDYMTHIATKRSKASWIYFGWLDTRLAYS